MSKLNWYPDNNLNSDNNKKLTVLDWIVGFLGMLFIYILVSRLFE